jgi:hypothetical protein
MLQFHPDITAALVEQRQAELRRQAEQARLARSFRISRKAQRRAAHRWWRLARRPSYAQPSS